MKKTSLIQVRRKFSSMVLRISTKLHVASTVMKKFTFNDSVMDDVAVLMPENQSSVDLTDIFRMHNAFQ